MTTTAIIKIKTHNQTVQKYCLSKYHMLPRISAVKTHVKTSYMMKITFMDSISQANINYGIENPIRWLVIEF